MCRCSPAGYPVNVSRRIFQCAAALVLIFATVTPLVNCFDSWDKGQPPADDTEIHVAVLFVVAGFAMVLPKLVRHLLNSGIRIERTARIPCFELGAFFPNRITPEPTASPPLISLRI